jgi:hypothetical protein
VIFHTENIKGKRILDYCGKPNIIIANQVVGLAHKRGHLWFKEFDRGGIVRMLTAICPRFDLPIALECAALRMLYYPVLNGDAQIFQPWAALPRPRLVRMDLFGREWVAYLPEGYSSAALEDYARWVRATKFQWKK